MSSDFRDAYSNTYVDENGKYHYRDSDGKVHWGIPAPKSRVISKPGEFTEYDSSQGHCGLCGSISCRGGCFK